MLCLVSFVKSHTAVVSLIVQNDIAIAVAVAALQTIDPALCVSPLLLSAPQNCFPYATLSPFNMWPCSYVCGAGVRSYAVQLRQAPFERGRQAVFW